MEKRIELEKRNRPLDQIGELNLDNCRSTTIEGLTEEFVNLRYLSMNGVGLTSLKGLPALPKLQRLEMGDNRIAGGLQILKECPRLSLLNLSNNKIKDLETLEPLKELPALKSLDLYRNDVTSIEDYRVKVFELLPGLNYLDGTDVENKEADESDGDGEALDDEEPETEPTPVNGKTGPAGDSEVSEAFKTGNGAESSPESFNLSPEQHQLGLGATEEVYDSSSVAEGDAEEDEDDMDEEDEAAEDEPDEAAEDEPDEDDEVGEDEEEEEAVGLKDIYREDLENQSDGGEYEEEEDSDDLDEEDEEDSELALQDTSMNETPEIDGEVEGDEEPRRGVKRQHEGDDDEEEEVDD